MWVWVCWGCARDERDLIKKLLPDSSSCMVPLLIVDNITNYLTRHFVVED